MVARGKGASSPLLGVASHRPHRHAAWKIPPLFESETCMPRRVSNVALSEKNSVSEQKSKKIVLRGREFLGGVAKND